MLYIVATPIGNLADISFRAIDILKSVDLILCEDTRVTAKLLSYFKIGTRTMSYHQHSKLQKMEKIKEILQSGKKVALVSDAGTPGISDPGGQLVKFISDELKDIKIEPIPGASAVISALSVSGFPTDKFLFLGFPPHKKGRAKFWREVSESNHTVAFYESKHRIIKSLKELQIEVKNPNVLVARELTKMFETLYRGRLDDIIEDIEKETPKGEYVVIISSR